MLRLCLSGLLFSFSLMIVQDEQPPGPVGQPEIVDAAKPPPIPFKQIKAAVGQLVRLERTDLKPASWVLIDEKGTADIDVRPDGTRANFVAQKAGRYYVVATADKDSKDSTPLVVVLAVGTADPEPPQPPTPPDPPTPGVKKPWGVVVVEETADAVKGRGAYFTSVKLQAVMDKGGMKFRPVDKDVKDKNGQTPADVKRFIDAAGGKNYPQFFVVATDGTTITTGDLPPDPATLADILTKYLEAK